MDRRDFLKWGCVGAGTAMVAGLAGCAPSSKKEGTTEVTNAADVAWTEEYDVVVVGGGGAGFCAAIEAAEAGSSVVILEKSPVCGGDTALSNGMMLGAGTPEQASLEGCTDDSPEKFAEEQLAYAQGFGNAEMIKEMCLESAKAVDWIVNTCGREYRQVDVVPPVNAYTNEYYPRSHWDNSQVVAGGAQVDTTKTHFGCLQKKADAYEGITVKIKTEVVHVIADGGEVVGVQTADDEFFKAKKGVVLATCSIGDNMEMARALNPQQYWGLYQREENGAPCFYVSSPYNTGDGIRMGIELGADVVTSGACVMLDNMYFGGVGSGRGIPEENEYKSTSILGKIIVNAKGNRFLQEDADWGYISTMQYLENVKLGGGSERNDAWCIVDGDHVPEASAISKMREMDAEGRFVKVADTLEELAEAIGVPARNLAKTVETWNGYCADGVDPDFDRRTDFAPIVNAPFYAANIVQNCFGACDGLRTDIDTRVLDTQGEPIGRLFAAGQVAAGNFTGPFYPGCGWAVLGTVHWGRKAGRTVAALESRE
ncbi:FAD-dependent oxidoreductase [Arabiibacter massiliensis]|uniref:FAD-dependent oxidoreductase n=1 Tax=Arabiibacter massiliensis TaxID=1870985 RepID=UPI0009BB225D|nr:FAD-dependent oxidoreductase [Arabiibacter massiliensis]